MSRQYKVHRRIHNWMLEFQRNHGRPPTLREVKDAQNSMEHRSSARHTLRILTIMGWVREVKPEGHARRYEAVLPQKAAM